EDGIRDFHVTGVQTCALPIFDFMLAELKHTGNVHSAMARMPHYFTAFQTYLMQAAEDDRSRFDMRVAVEILRFEAQYKADGASEIGRASCRERVDGCVVCGGG